MPVIRPISNLRNKSNEISKFAHDNDEPIFITKNGKGDLVVMSLAYYSKLQLRLNLFSKLAVAQNQKASGNKGSTMREVVESIRKMLHEKI